MTSEEELIKSGVIANENTIILGFKRFALNAQYRILMELSELMKGLFLFISHGTKPFSEPDVVADYSVLVPAFELDQS